MKVLAPILRKWALSFENAISMGLRSGWRQEQEPATGVAQCLCGVDVPVRSEVVEDDHGAGGEFGHEHFFHVSGECGAVHRALDDPGRDHGLGAQSGDEGLGAPRAEGRVHDQPMTARCLSTLPGQIGSD